MIIARKRPFRSESAVDVVVSFWLVIVIGVMTGCQVISKVDHAPPLRKSSRTTGEPEFDPSGQWLYIEGGMTYPLTLDQSGNGKYEWKDGHFRTVSVMDGLWSGTWHQPGNDREGGFELRLSADKSSAKGRWWYTRIGDDRSPQKPGGVFSLSRELEIEETNTP